MKMLLNAIASVDSNFGLGYNGKLLFKDKTDMMNFKKYTLNHTVIMGRKTYESIGKLLPDRTNIVLTHSADNIKHKKRLIIMSDVGELCTYISNRKIPNKYDEYYVIGGGQIYELLLPYTKRVILTHFDYECTDPKPDTYFPRIDKLDKWKLNEYISIYLTNEGYKAKICEWIHE